MKKHHLILLFITLLACAGPQKSFEKKDYEKAYKLALKELQKGKGVNQNKKILSQSLSYLIEEKHDEIAKMLQSNNLETWEKAIGINRNLQNKILAASPHLGDQYERTAVDLEEQELYMMKSIYDIYFNDGKEKLTNALAENNKALAQNAYYDLVQAKEYATALSPELDSLIHVSLINGVVNYTVTTHTLFAVNYRWEIDREFDDIGEYSSRFRSIHFDSKTDIADCLIEIEFDNLNFYFEDTYDRRRFAERVITGYNTVVDTSGRSREEPIYQTVEGIVDIYTRVKTARWNVDIDASAKTNNCDVSSDRFDVNMESVIEEYQLQGDLRAIPPEYQNAPREQFLSNGEMAEELVKIIYDEVGRRCFN